MVVCLSEFLVYYEMVYYAIESNLLPTAVRATVGIAVWIGIGTVSRTTFVIAVGNVKRAFVARGILIVCWTKIGNPRTDVGVWKGIKFGIQLTLVLNRAVRLIQSWIGEIRRLTAAGKDCD